MVGSDEVVADPSVKGVGLSLSTDLQTAFPAEGRRKRASQRQMGPGMSQNDQCEPVSYIPTVSNQLSLPAVDRPGGSLRLFVAPLELGDNSYRAIRALPQKSEIKGVDAGKG